MKYKFISFHVSSLYLFYLLLVSVSTNIIRINVGKYSSLFKKLMITQANCPMVWNTGCPRKSEKSNHLVWYENKIEFLFLAHQLRGNMCPFCLITQTKPLCLLFLTKISMQKNHRNAKMCHFRPILANWLYQKANWGPF